MAAEQQYDSLAWMSNGPVQLIKVVYKRESLKTIITLFKRTFQALGFDQVGVDWEDLVLTVAKGGEIRLKGPMFMNRETYDSRTMYSMFMVRERALVRKLMTIVFIDHVSFLREPTPFQEVSLGFKFNTSVAFRKSTFEFHAEDYRPEDTYTVIVEGQGSGENQCVHMFKFQPSMRWMINRYPVNVD